MDAFRSALSLVRDGMLLVLLLMLLVWPTALNDRLVQAGVTELHGPGFDWKAPTKKAKETSLAAAAAVEQSKNDIMVLRAKLDGAVAADPQLQAHAAPIRAALGRSNASLDAASAHLASTITTQQIALRAANVDTVPLSGWVYLGTLDATKSHWKGPDETTGLNWPIANGATARIDTDAYVRADAAGDMHTSGSFLGVAARGAIVTIQSTHLEPQLADGRYPVWAHVTVQD